MLRREGYTLPSMSWPLTQPRVQLAVHAPRAHCWLRPSLSFFAELLHQAGITLCPCTRLSFLSRGSTWYYSFTNSAGSSCPVSQPVHVPMDYTPKFYTLSVSTIAPKFGVISQLNESVVRPLLKLRSRQVAGKDPEYSICHWLPDKIWPTNPCPYEPHE